MQWRVEMKKSSGDEKFTKIMNSWNQFLLHRILSQDKIFNRLLEVHRNEL